MLPAGITHRSGDAVLRTASLGFALPTSRFDSPGSCGELEDARARWLAHVGVDQQHALAGLRQRQWPGCSRPCVLPSPGPVLVTTIDRGPSSADENSTFVRIARNASAKFAGTPLLISGCPPASLAVERRHIPRDGSPRCVLISSGVLIRLSRYSKKNASPHAASDAAEQRQQQVERLAAGSTGLQRPLGRDRRCGCCWSSARRRCRFPWRAASGCRRSAGCSATSRSSTP